MDSLALVDPELRSFLDAWPAITFSAETLAGVRAMEMPLPHTPDNGTTLRKQLVPGLLGAPDVCLHIYHPPETPSEVKPLGCIFHVHGGGYVMGAAGDLEQVYRALISRIGCVLVSVEYRLAPETKFPGAIEDCYAGLAWVFANAEELGVDTQRIGVMGESAGGGLAAALALMVRDRGEYTLAFQHLIYPMLDDRTAVRPPHPYAGKLVWNNDSNHFGWESLLGEAPGGPNISFYAAAARAENLAGLPPSYVATAALDLFVDENILYAQRLIHAGVPTELHVYPGAFHGFTYADAAVARQANADSDAALIRALSPPAAK
jgi:acetyl esterase/lipase